ncbi:hypothetical protein FRC12_014394, partial [Ceratobasidium sp. 428]
MTITSPPNVTLTSIKAKRMEQTPNFDALLSGLLLSATLQVDAHLTPRICSQSPQFSAFVEEPIGVGFTRYLSWIQ